MTENPEITDLFRKLRGEVARVCKALDPSLRGEVARVAAVVGQIAVCVDDERLRAVAKKEERELYAICEQLVLGGDPDYYRALSLECADAIRDAFVKRGYTPNAVYGKPLEIVTFALGFVSDALIDLRWPEARQLLYRAQYALRPLILTTNEANFHEVLYRHWQQRIHEALDVLDNENTPVARALLEPVAVNMRKFLEVPNLDDL